LCGKLAPHGHRQQDLWCDALKVWEYLESLRKSLSELAAQKFGVGESLSGFWFAGRKAHKKLPSAVLFQILRKMMLHF